MSTRATYKIGTRDSHSVVFYIHHDGYPEGAAEYFLAAATANTLRGGMAERFVRANDNAEFTTSHQIHGDTEFRYTLDVNHTLYAEARVDFSDKWEGIYMGPLADFIQAKTGTKLLRTGGMYLRDQAAGEKIAGILQKGHDAIARGWSGNASSYASEAWNLIKLYRETFGRDAIIEKAESVLCTLDRILSKSWEGQYGENAYAKWRESFRK